MQHSKSDVNSDIRQRIASCSFDLHKSSLGGRIHLIIHYLLINKKHKNGDFQEKAQSFSGIGSEELFSRHSNKG